jgi:hypothetical protein
VSEPTTNPETPETPETPAGATGDAAGGGVVRIVTDSSCDLPDDVVRDLGIEIVPLSIRFGPEEFVDREQLSTAEFWARCAASDTLPETAAPAPGQFEQCTGALATEGATGIVVVTFSGALSATMQSAELAARSVADAVEVRVVDSRTVTLGVGTIASRAPSWPAGRDARRGPGARHRPRRSHPVFGALDTLENLRRAGGSAMPAPCSHRARDQADHRGPIDGKVEEGGKQRTRAKASRSSSTRSEFATMPVASTSPCSTPTAATSTSFVEHAPPALRRSDRRR